MNEIILKSIISKITNKKTKLYISTLTYYSIIAIIPTLVLSATILRIFNLEFYFQYKYIIDEITLSPLSNLIISLITLYMISRIFYILLKDRFSLLKSVVITIVFSLLLVLFLSLFFASYLVSNIYLSLTIKIILLFSFCFLLLYFTSNSKLKYNFIFSFFFSIISIIFINFFILITSFFINYENYYGILAPVFIIILALNLFIYLAYITYIGAEEFTKISSITIIKR